MIPPPLIFLPLAVELSDLSAPRLTNAELIERIPLPPIQFRKDTKAEVYFVEPGKLPALCGMKVEVGKALVGCARWSPQADVRDQLLPVARPIVGERVLPRDRLRQRLDRGARAMSDIPLREYFENEIASLRREIEGVTNSARLALESADKAAKIIDDNFEKRMDTTNEWRAALEDQAKRLATAESVETIKTRVDALEKKIDAMLNKVVGFGILVTLVVSLIAIFGQRV